MKAIEYADGSSVAYSHDGNGNRLTMRDGLGLTSYTYDGANRLRRKVDPYGQVITYTYDGVALKDVELPTGKISYTYNQAGFPVSMVVTDPGASTETTTFTWDGVGHLKSQTSVPPGQGGSGFVTTWTYDQAERMTQVVGAYNGSTRYSQSYQYDASGSATQDTLDNSYDGATRTRSYSYDPLYRLTKAADSDNWARSYTYDGVGNRRTRQVRQSGTLKLDEAYTFDPADRLLSLTRTDSQQSPAQTTTVSYEWDANGNQTRVTDSKTGVTTYTYDFANRLIKGQFGDGSVVSHGYDGDGVRLWSTDPHQAVRYVVDRGHIVAELDGAGAVISATWRRPDGQPLSAHQRDGTYYFHQDRLGSVVGLLKPDGTWDTHYQYDEFGQVTANKGSAWNTFQFTGAVYNERLGLYNLGARDYSPAIGRFITQDTYKGSPWQPWTQNLYVYVGNNPVNYVDPTGHEAWTASMGFTVAFLIGIKYEEGVAWDDQGNRETYTTVGLVFGFSFGAGASGGYFDVPTVYDLEGGAGVLGYGLIGSGEYTISDGKIIGSSGGVGEGWGPTLYVGRAWTEVGELSIPVTTKVTTKVTANTQEGKVNNRCSPFILHYQGICRDVESKQVIYSFTVAPKPGEPEF